MSEINRKLAALATAFVIALGGLGVGACGDDKDGPAEDAGEAIDEAGEDIEKSAEEAGKEVDENVDVDVGDDASKKGD